MPVKAKILTSLAVVAVAVPTAIAVTTLSSADAAPRAAVAQAQTTLPLTITNNTGRGEQVFLYVLGQSLTTNKLGYSNAQGVFTPWTGGGNPPVPAPDVSIPGPGKGGSTTIQIPRLSGRVYMAFGQKLKFSLTPDGLVQPAPWNAADPNRDINFDWAEFTLNESGLWLNSSQVDMFAIPHEVSVKGRSGAVRKTGALVNNGRNRMLDALKNQPGSWSKLIHTRADGTRLRAIAPGKAMDAGVFPRNYYDPYVNRVWDTYRTKTLTLIPFSNEPNAKFFGRTQGDALVFTDTAGKKVASFQKPSTADIFGCAGRLGAPNDRIVGPIARTLCAAFNRSTLHNVSTQPDTNAKGFYKELITNHYSRKIHNHMADGKAYGFAFDDVGAFESLVHDGDPVAAGITLCPF